MILIPNANGSHSRISPTHKHLKFSGTLVEVGSDTPTTRTLEPKENITMPTSRPYFCRYCRESTPAALPHVCQLSRVVEAPGPLAMTLDGFLSGVLSDVTGADVTFRSTVSAFSEKPYADAPAYTVRIAVDGDEIELPFQVRSARDYAEGEELETVARRIANEVVTAKWSTVNEVATVSLYSAEPVADCTGDFEPTPLVVAHAYRW